MASSRLTVVLQVVQIVLGWVPDRFSDVRVRGKMHDRLGGIGSEDKVQKVPVPNISQDEFSKPGKIPMSLTQIVQHHDLVTMLGQFETGVRTYISSAAGNENTFLQNRTLVLQNTKTVNIRSLKVLQPGPSTTCNITYISISYNVIK